MCPGFFSENKKHVATESRGPSAKPSGKKRQAPHLEALNRKPGLDCPSASAEIANHYTLNPSVSSSGFGVPAADFRDGAHGCQLHASITKTPTMTVVDPNLQIKTER